MRVVARGWGCLLGCPRLKLKSDKIRVVSKGRQLKKTEEGVGVIFRLLFKGSRLSLDFSPKHVPARTHTAAWLLGNHTRLPRAYLPHKKRRRKRNFRLDTGMQTERKRESELHKTHVPHDLPRGLLHRLIPHLVGTPKAAPLCATATTTAATATTAASLTTQPRQPTLITSILLLLLLL